MTRSEFTGQLREFLLGEEIPANVIEENVRFYNRYIDDELQKGMTEAQVFAELGDPRMIARTIADTWQSEDTSLGGDSHTYDTDGTYGGYRQEDGYGSYGQTAGGRNGGMHFSFNGRQVNTNKWYMKLIPIAILAIVALIIFFFMWVGIGILGMIVRLLTSPIFWVIVIGCWIYKTWIRRR